MGGGVSQGGSESNYYTVILNLKCAESGKKKLLQL